MKASTNALFSTGHFWAKAQAAIKTHLVHKVGTAVGFALQLAKNLACDIQVTHLCGSFTSPDPRLLRVSAFVDSEPVMQGTAREFLLARSHSAGGHAEIQEVADELVSSSMQSWRALFRSGRFSAHGDTAILRRMTLQSAV